MSEVISRYFSIQYDVKNRPTIVETEQLLDNSQIITYHSVEPNQVFYFNDKQKTEYSESEDEYLMTNYYRKKAKSLVKLALKYYLHYEYKLDAWLFSTFFNVIKSVRTA